MSHGMEVKVSIKGMSDVANALAELEPKIAKGVLRKALRAVGRYWKQQIVDHVPIGNPDKAKQKDYDPGELKDSIIYRVSARKGTDKTDGRPTGIVRVGPGYKSGADKVSPGVYGMFVEFGLKRKKYPAHPFVRPVFDGTSTNAESLFAETMRSGLKDSIK